MLQRMQVAELESSFFSEPRSKASSSQLCLQLVGAGPEIVGRGEERARRREQSQNGQFTPRHAHSCGQREAESQSRSQRS